MRARYGPVACLTAAAATITLVAIATISLGEYGSVGDRLFGVHVVSQPARPAASASGDNTTTESPNAGPVPLPSSTGPVDIGWTPSRASTDPAPSASPSATRSASGPGTTHPTLANRDGHSSSIPSSTDAASTGASNTEKPNTHASTPTASATSSASAGSCASATPLETVADAVLAALNSAREAGGLPALSPDADLQCSAHAHNLVMAAADTLTLQAPAEQTLQARVGSAWTQLARSVARANLTPPTDPASLDLASLQSAATALSVTMRASVAPAEVALQGARSLVDAATYVGVDVYLDTVHNLLWITQDFGQR